MSQNKCIIGNFISSEIFKGFCADVNFESISYASPIAFSFLKVGYCGRIESYPIILLIISDMMKEWNYGYMISV